MNDTVNIIETLTDGMEVIEMVASTAALAMKLGREKAARWTARGYAFECIGVQAHTATVMMDGYLIQTSGFRPVCKEVK
jgi:hypothetical protein